MIRQFINIYRIYRKAHGPVYAARIAYGCAVKGYPF